MVGTYYIISETLKDSLDGISRNGELFSWAMHGTDIIIAEWLGADEYFPEIRGEGEPVEIEM